MINPNTKVVPIDHGWANMKTEQDVFTSGVSEITTEPALFNDVLEYNNKYYKIGGKRLEVKEDKVHERLSALNALLNMDEKGNDGIDMDDEPEVPKSEEEVADRLAKNIPLAEKTVGTRSDKGIRQYADAPAERVSLKVKLEAMKAKVAVGDSEKLIPQKAKGKEETL